MYNRYQRPNNSRRFFRPNRFGRKRVNSNVVYSYIEKAAQSKHIATEVIVPNTVLFNELEINQTIKRNISQAGLSQLTPIQVKGIPAILSGKNVIGIANTGTGKTAAFLIPLIENIFKNNSYKALIITPTRELALQIRDELRKFSYGMNIYSTLCIGKSSISNQIYDLRRNPHVVVGTPGRIKDLIERKVLKLSEFQTVVLDEVDQMLDMGFINDVRHIISFLPEKRQSLFFSATVSSEINRLIQSFAPDPVVISVKTQESRSNIQHTVHKIQNGETKMQILDSLLKKEEFKKVLVFGRTKMGVEKLSRELFDKGHKVASIHGDKPQFKRQQAIRYFKEDVVKVLVATDVAARGLDIANITHVINYDVPESYETYIHRTGRTGRVEQKGIALTIIE